MVRDYYFVEKHFVNLIKDANVISYFHDNLRFVRIKSKDNLILFLTNLFEMLFEKNQ